MNAQSKLNGSKVCAFCCANLKKIEQNDKWPKTLIVRLITSEWHLGVDAPWALVPFVVDDDVPPSIDNYDENN